MRIQNVRSLIIDTFAKKLRNMMYVMDVELSLMCPRV